jgi:hypothetical protein
MFYSKSERRKEMTKKKTTEYVIFAYFLSKSKMLRSYSMLRTTLTIKNNINLGSVLIMLYDQY